MGDWLRLFGVRFFIVIFSSYLFTFDSAWSVQIALNQRLQAELDYPNSGFTLPIRKGLFSKHIVFVDGIMNELANIPKNYFRDNIREIKRLGLRQTHLAFSSRVSIPENADALYWKLREIYMAVQVPLILVGHSMGGAQAIQAVLRHPDLITSFMVDRVILLQAAIGGSPLASHFNSTPWAWAVERYLSDGLKSLRPEVAAQDNQEAWGIFQDTLAKKYGHLGILNVQVEAERISKKIFYVRSYLPSSESLSLGLQMVLMFCEFSSMGSSLNDGLLRVEDQFLNVEPSFGVDLGVLEADHIELVVSGVVSRSNRLNREAFTRAILQSVYQE